MRTIGTRPVALTTLAALVDQVDRIETETNRVDTTDVEALKQALIDTRARLREVRRQLKECIGEENPELGNLIVDGFRSRNNDKLAYAEAVVAYAPHRLAREYTDTTAVNIARALVSYFQPRFRTVMWEAFVSKHSLT